MADEGTNLPTGALGEFEGRPIMSQAIRLTKAGDGLSAAVSIAPIDLHMGQELYFAGRGNATKVHYERVLDKGEDTGFVRRVITIEVETMTPVRKQAVNKALTDTERAIERAKGIEQLPGFREEGEEVGSE